MKIYASAAFIVILSSCAGDRQVFVKGAVEDFDQCTYERYREDRLVESFVIKKSFEEGYAVHARTKFRIRIICDDELKIDYQLTGEDAIVDFGVITAKAERP